MDEGLAMQSEMLKISVNAGFSDALLLQMRLFPLSWQEACRQQSIILPVCAGNKKAGCARSPGSSFCRRHAGRQIIYILF
jgi:hypothetical protein